MAVTSADRIVVTTVTENYVDMLLADAPRVTRAGLAHHFDPKRQNPVAENGVAFHVRIEWGRYVYQVLFDTGMSSRTLLHNAGALGIDLAALDHIVISHGHPDHYGGLIGLLSSFPAEVPVSLGAAAFLPRYLRLASGQVAPYYNQDFTLERIASAGGRPVTHDDALEVGPGAIATGSIPRSVDFEMASDRIDTANALIQVVNGRMVPDSVPDDQAMVINLGKDGIVVFVGCSHAGIVNTLKRAVEITGRSRILGVFGGMHLGFPGTPDSKTTKTIDIFKSMNIELLCPMHCTGMDAMMKIKAAFPEEFLLNCTGTKVELEA